VFIALPRLTGALSRALVALSREFIALPRLTGALSRALVVLSREFIALPRLTGALSRPGLPWIACETVRCCCSKDGRALSDRSDANRGELNAFDMVTGAPIRRPPKFRLSRVGDTGTAPWMVPMWPPNLLGSTAMVCPEIVP
jgi:hypothetical protein